MSTKIENLPKKKYKILFVEDEPEVGSLIASYLSKNGMDVFVVPKAEGAIDHIKRLDPDLLLLDIKLPGKDGMALCREVRPFYQKPVIMFTTHNNDVTHILSLEECKANDYILKTTPPTVLLARLRLHLRLYEESLSKDQNDTNYSMLRFGALTIDPVNRQVILRYKNISLSTADFDLLYTLASNAGKVMDRNLLLQKLRGIEYDGANRCIDIAVSRLRKKLGDDSIHNQRIKTVRNRGYLFAPDVWE